MTRWGAESLEEISDEEAASDDEGSWDEEEVADDEEFAVDERVSEELPEVWPRTSPGWWRGPHFWSHPPQ